MSARLFRFGVVAAYARSADEWIAKARRVEALGYSTLVMPDGLRHILAPWAALASAATATTTLRVGTYVLDNDYRHPVMLAKDAATLDLLSGGRLELGIGAGRPTAADDNRMLGRSFDSGAVRLARLTESIALLKPLLGGQPTIASGPRYPIADRIEISPAAVQQPHPPLLVAGIGRQLLSMAAREADIIALGLPPDAPENVVAEKVGWIKQAAGDRFDQIELNLNLMAVADQVPSFVGRQLGLTAAGLASAGAMSAVVGSVDEMVETLESRRARLGISYFMVADELMEIFAPVVERLTGK